jgi:hypothetical protein
MDREAGRTMSKATVRADIWWWEERPGIPSVTWIASHDCNWHEHLAAWHNAFWAADHHVRYDCGRRKQPSSGAYEMTHAGFRAGRPVLTERDGFADGDIPRGVNTGGVQKGPSPTCTDSPGVNPGVGDSYARGGAQAGSSGGSAGVVGRVVGS